MKNSLSTLFHSQLNRFRPAVAANFACPEPIGDCRSLSEEEPAVPSCVRAGSDRRYNKTRRWIFLEQFHKLLFLAFVGLLTLAPPLPGQTNPVPFVHQPLVPTAVAPGGPDFTLTVNGAGFVPESVIQWNGNLRPTTFISNIKLTAAIPATDISTIGCASVTVFNPAPGGGVSNAEQLLITSPISSVSFNETHIGSEVAAMVSAAADFDGDEKPDIAVLQDSGAELKSVLIFLGNGDGTFQGQRSFPADGRAGGGGRMVLGDFNGDGKIDIAVANYQSKTDPSQGSITVLLGNGDGTLQPAVSTTVPSRVQQEMVSADFNGDGALDVALAATASSGAEVQILLGRGDGSFATGLVYFSSPPYATRSLLGLAVGDFDRNGVPDLVLSLFQRDTRYGGYYFLSPLLGNGDGSFRWGTDFTGAGGYGITAVDLNADGNLDLAGGYPIDPQYLKAGVYILFGAGDGTIQGAVGLQVGSGSVTGQPVAADINGDGKLDLITPGQDQFFVLIGNGAGSFQTPGTPYYPAPYPPFTGPALADFNGDGRLDLAMGILFGSSLSVFLQPSLVDLLPGGFHFGDQLIGTPENTATATLTNNAGGPLAVSSIALTGTDAADFTQTNDCPLAAATLAAGASCTINVAFLHDNLGEKAAAVVINSDAPGFPQQVLNLTGTIVDPAVTLSSTSLEFGEQPIDVTSAPQTVTLTNSGVGALTIVSITATGDFEATNNCGTRLAEGAQCTLNITFNPQDGATFFGTVTIENNSAAGPQIISLRGTGLRPTLTLSAASLTFGEQLVYTISPPQTVTLTNNGPGPLTMINPTVTSEFGVTSNCPGTVAVSASCTVSVTFQPIFNGTRNGTATINDNAAGGPHTVTLTGTGLGPVASVSASSLNFPNQPVQIPSPPQIVTLTNTGGALMTLSSILATGPFVKSNDCSATLSAGAGCTITVVFTPTTTGPAQGSLSVTSDAPGTPPIDLVGNGMDLQLTLPAGASNSATVTAGSTATYNFVLDPKGFVGNASLTCAWNGPQPVGANCTVTPATLTLNGADPAPLAVNVTTNARAAAAPFGDYRSPLQPIPWARYAVPLLAALLMLMLAMVRRGVAPPFRAAFAGLKPGATWAPFAMAVLIVLLWASCGGGGTRVAPRPPGTPAGDYTLTLTVAAGEVSRTAVLGLKVN